MTNQTPQRRIDPYRSQEQIAAGLGVPVDMVSAWEAGEDAPLVDQRIAEAATAEKIRENRLRRMAERQGLALQKSRRRDPRAVDFGTYMLVDTNSNAVVATVGEDGYGLTLNAIEAWLTK
jgi:hypothetical protein